MSNNPFIEIKDFPIVYNKSLKEDTIVFKYKINSNGTLIKRIKDLERKGHFNILFAALLMSLSFYLKKIKNPSADKMLEAIEYGFNILVKTKEI